MTREACSRQGRGASKIKRWQRQSFNPEPAATVPSAVAAGSGLND